jgi:Flp pilus assembly protein TadD
LAAGRNRRVVLIVAVAALAAAGAIVGGTALQSRNERTSVPGAVTSPRPGPPFLELELGLRSEPEAQALERAQALLDAKSPQPAAAAAIFRRYRSFEAQLGLAFATWTGPGSLGAVQQLAAAHPNDPAALLNLGWADYQAGRNADAVAAWQKTARRFPDSPYGVDAEDPLHPNSPSGLPPIVTGLAPPAAVAKMPATQELAALARAAAKPNEDAKLLYGAALWGLKMPVSAERQFAAAAKLAPRDAIARTLAAVGFFSKANPRAAFGRLGPLTAVFPNSPVVELHLGVLLIYIGKSAKAVEHLHAAVADGPHTPWAQAARRLLAILAGTRPK